MPRPRPQPEVPDRQGKTTGADPQGEPRTAVAVLAASVLGVAAASSIFLLRIRQGFDLRYADTGLPMLVEADGFHFLARARALLEGRAVWTSEPALSALGALAAKATGLPLELAAFWLPVALASACGVWIWAWARLLGAPTTMAVLAACAGALVPAWFERASPGWFDTDPGVAFLWHGCLYATARLGLSQGRPLARHVLLFATCAAGLGWWWRPGLILLPLCLLLWSGTFAFVRDRAWRLARLGVLICTVLALLYFCLTPNTGMPQALVQARGYAWSHVSAMFGLSREVAFLSVDELKSATVQDIARGLGGNAAAGALAMLAALLLCLRHPRPALFLLPSLLAAPLALSAQRFLFLAALPAALGLGLLPSHVPILPAKRAALLGWILSLLVVASILEHHATRPLALIFLAPQDRLALALRQAAPPGARLWNWWDDGYFLAARSGLAPLFDGGSQTTRLCFIAARPLLAEDPLLARRWMRFFALRGANATAPLAVAWGGEAAAWRHLERILASPDPQRELASLPPLPGGPGWLLPEGRVFLYLPQRFLRLSSWWVALGASPEPDVSARRRHIDVFQRGDFRNIPERRQVKLPEAVLAKGYRDFGAVFETDRTPLAPPWGGGAPGPFVVASARSPWLYVVDETAIASVAFRLLAPGGAELPGFVPVAADYAHGGVWEVLP